VDFFTERRVTVALFEVEIDSREAVSMSREGREMEER